VRIDCHADFVPATDCCRQQALEETILHPWIDVVVVESEWKEQN
jgi:hypothetical protein